MTFTPTSPSPKLVCARKQQLVVPQIVNQTKSTQVARAFFLKQTMPGGDLNGAGRCKSEECGWLLAVGIEVGLDKY
jgi:hypothetical protein